MPRSRWPSGSRSRMATRASKFPRFAHSARKPESYKTRPLPAEPSSSNDLCNPRTSRSGGAVRLVLCEREVRGVEAGRVLGEAVVFGDRVRGEVLPADKGGGTQILFPAEMFP